MRYPVNYSKLALNDLEQIYDFIAQDNPTAAQDFVDEINEKINHLSKFPELGHTPRQSYLKAKGYRILVISDYLVFYHVKPKEVKIDRIIHGKRRYAFLL